MKKETDIKKALDKLVQMNYLKETDKGYMDSDRVKSLLKEGKSRKQIQKILDNEYTHKEKDAKVSTKKPEGLYKAKE